MKINVILFVILDSHHTSLAYQDMFEQASENSISWRCKSCSKEVTNRWHHFHSHRSQRSFCPYCPSTYSRIDTLRSHMRTKHASLLAGKHV